MIRNQQGVDRGMSIALTHVLTIGITTLLIGMLLMGGSTMLESETESSTTTSLETVGERLVGELENVDRMATKEGTENVSLVADHPRSITNSGYVVEYDPDCGDEGEECLRLSADDVDEEVRVHVDLETDVEPGTVHGGSIEISYEDGTITLQEADR